LAWISTPSLSLPGIAQVNVTWSAKAGVAINNAHAPA
jgi:hypothetical protein